MRARNPARPAWDRDLFLKQFAADHPFDPRGPGFADIFKDAIDASRGNPAEFESQLNDRLQEASEPADKVTRYTFISAAEGKLRKV